MFQHVSVCFLALWVCACRLHWGRAGLAREGDTFCHLLTPDPPGRAWTFLSRAGQRLVLFHTRWGGQGQLLRCNTWEEANLTSPYLTSCRDQSWRFLDTRWLGLERQLKLLERMEWSCTKSKTARDGQRLLGAPVGERGATGSGQTLATSRGVWSLPPTQPSPTHLGSVGRREEAKRSRRGLTMPGTIWCGAGDSAESFSDLGTFNHTDICCREHDHCKYKLSAFEYNYGMRNFRLHTISHCDCDYSFKHCLLQLNNTVSTLVGMTFFNLLEIPCFTLEKVKQCVRWTWWGSCNGTGLVARAMLRSTFRYNYTHPLLEEMRLGWWPSTNPSGGSGSGSGSGSFSQTPPTDPITHWQPQTSKSPKLKRKGRKKDRKINGHRKNNLKAPSRNTLETRLEVWSPGVRVETTGPPRFSVSASVTNCSAEALNMGLIDTTTTRGKHITSKHAVPSTMSQSERSTAGTVQPLTHQPLTHQPLTHQPLTHQPLTHQPLTDQSLTDQILTDQPSTHQPSTHQPLTHQPLTHQPLTHQPLTHQPLTHQPLTDQLLTDQTFTHQTFTHQLLTHQPLTHQPLTDQPLTDQTLTDQHSTHQPSTHQPSTHQPLTHQPFTHQPLTNQPLTDQPLTDQTLTLQTSTHQTSTHQPLTHHPLNHQPLTHQPLTHQLSWTVVVGEIVSSINVRAESLVPVMGERFFSSGLEENDISSSPTPPRHWGHINNTGLPDPQPHHLTPNQPDKHGGYKSCGCYKRLDRCEHKIAPKQFKFYYHNLEPKTIFHCNCTKRLVKRMKKEGNPEVLQGVLSHFVSLSCFHLTEPKGECGKAGNSLCEQSPSAVAVLSRAKHLHRALKVRRAADKSQYPALDERGGGRNSSRMINLYHKCLQAIHASRMKD